MMDLRELLRYIRTNQSDRAIQRALGIDRRTVKHYRAWAVANNLLTGPLPAPEELREIAAQTLSSPAPPQMISTVEPFRDLVVQLRNQNTEMMAIWERLKERGYTGSYSSIRRFVHSLERADSQEAYVRVETLPGQEVQVDFGYAGRMLDPHTNTLRRTWVFVMIMSWSRHMFVQFVFDQTVATWIALHRSAFEFFSGVPRRVVIDNLKAGITKACWDDPEVQLAYRECAEHYGFLIAPCKPRTPQHKGKVEQGGVHYVKRNFLGGRTPTSITQANRDVLEWNLRVAGTRIHGTTKLAPLERFVQEVPHLGPLPRVPYDLAIWKQATVHRDCYVVFENAFYSAPFRLIGQRVRVRGGSREVRLYTEEFELVATHSRASQPGERLTHPDHLPPDKLQGLELDARVCQETASDIGPATRKVVDELLGDGVIDRRRTVLRLLRLRERYGDERLEVACERAVRFESTTYSTVKRILQQELDREQAEVPRSTPAHTFVRTAHELLGHLFGGE